MRSDQPTVSGLGVGLLLLQQVMIGGLVGVEMGMSCDDGLAMPLLVKMTDGGELMMSVGGWWTMYSGQPMANGQPVLRAADGG